ncbi:hypothetical protein [Chthonobacter rhizosphaerae]|uniref:hypothetical protein n=1 Tax=Chthonobacter rhizosphaerae TaxID=2735553 RepID=UPI0015EFD6FA|nr:hypothetical protein [Chthonobacter rhizosphaerae]
MRSAIMIALTAAYFAVAFASYTQVSAEPETQALAPCTAVAASGSTATSIDAGSTECAVMVAR